MSTQWGSVGSFSKNYSIVNYQPCIFSQPVKKGYTPFQDVIWVSVNIIFFWVYCHLHFDIKT